MRILSYVILALILVFLLVAFFKIQKVEYKIEHPNVLMCNGIVIDENMKNKLISLSNEYIKQKVGQDYFDEHFDYLSYSVSQDCTFRVNYLYNVKSFKSNVYVDISIGFIPEIKNSNTPNYPFEIYYGPKDFNITYDTYKLVYDRNSGFYYIFYKDGIKVGEGNAMSGKLIKEEVVE